MIEKHCLSAEREKGRGSLGKGMAVRSNKQQLFSVTVLHIGETWPGGSRVN